MQIFELHFNPKNKEGKIIDSFCYQPKDVYEKRLGSLVIGGSLDDGSLKNKTLLNNLSQKIKKSYHSLPTRSQEEALREGLTKGNDYLELDNSYDGDLNIAVLSIKNGKLQFSRIGDIKILLSRNKEITDIGKNASKNKNSFSSIVSGKIKKEDKLIILTEDIYQKFADQGLLINIAQSDSIGNNQLEEISKIQKERFPKTSGLCLLIDFSASNPESEKIINKDEFSFRKLLIKTNKEIKAVSLFLIKKGKSGAIRGFKFSKENIKPFLINLKKLLWALLKDAKRGLKELYQIILRKIDKLKDWTKESLANKNKKVKEKLSTVSKEKKKTNIKAETKESKENKSKNISIKVEKFFGDILNLLKKTLTNIKKEIGKLFKNINFNKYKSKIKIKIPENEEHKRNLYLAGLLLIIILTGSFFSQNERSRQLAKQQEILNGLEAQIEEINLTEDNSFQKLAIYHSDIDNLITQGVDYPIRANNIKKEIENKLLELSKTSIINNPEILFESNEIVPSKINLIGSELYLSNPFLPKAEKYNLETREQLIKPINFEDGGIYSIAASGSDVLFFSKPDLLSDQNNNKYQITSPYEETSFQEMKSFNGYLYFLERYNNQILRYNVNNLNRPNIWINERMSGDIVSIALDGSIWTLKSNNEIWQYANNVPVTGSNIDLTNTFPFPEKFTKIKTAVGAPLFIIEPRNKRILIVSKEGNLLKQYIIPSAQNIKDFTFTNKKIYLLDSQKVYSIEY
jgi:hypothetical protein